jgi:HEAT repeat protein
MRMYYIVCILCLVPTLPLWAAEATEAELRATDLATQNLPTPESAERFLHDENPLLRERAIYELGMLQSKAHLTEITEALSDESVDVRRAAVVALRLIQRDEAIIQLEELSETSLTPEIRIQAIHELEAQVATSALPMLLRQLKYEDAEVRLAAIEALGVLGDAVVVPHLIRALRHRNERMRRSAAIALGQLGPVAEPAVPLLIQRLRRDRDEHVRASIARALRKIGDARAVGPCLNALYDKTDGVRLEAFKTLGHWAQPGLEPLLARHLHKGRPHVRQYAAELLGRIRTEMSRTLLSNRLARETHRDVRDSLEMALSGLSGS